MKNFFATFSAFVINFFLLPSYFFASADQVCPVGFDNLCKLDVAQNPFIFGNVIQVLLVIAVILSVCFLIWGGIRWIMSAGDKGKVEQARATIIGAIIGLVISFLAYFIVTVIVYMLTGSSMNLPIPKLV